MDVWLGVGQRSHAVPCICYKRKASITFCTLPPIAGALTIISTVNGGIRRAVGCTGARGVFVVERRRAAGMRATFSWEALDGASLHTWGPFRL